MYLGLNLYIKGWFYNTSFIHVNPRSIPAKVTVIQKRLTILKYIYTDCILFFLNVTLDRSNILYQPMFLQAPHFRCHELSRTTDIPTFISQAPIHILDMHVCKDNNYLACHCSFPSREEILAITFTDRFCDSSHIA